MIEKTYSRYITDHTDALTPRALLGPDGQCFADRGAGQMMKPWGAESAAKPIQSLLRGVLLLGKAAIGLRR
jgi:hypothetical protein